MNQVLGHDVPGDVRSLLAERYEVYSDCSREELLVHWKLIFMTYNAEGYGALSKEEIADYMVIQDLYKKKR